jgi:hypothetical protein
VRGHCSEGVAVAHLVERNADEIGGTVTEVEGCRGCKLQPSRDLAAEPAKTLRSTAVLFLEWYPRLHG